eukprot:scaffold501519_cov18-Prasinocladus_malaysianus.AAC.2
MLFRPGQSLSKLVRHNVLQGYVCLHGPQASTPIAQKIENVEIPPLMASEENAEKIARNHINCSGSTGGYIVVCIDSEVLFSDFSWIATTDTGAFLVYLLPSTRTSTAVARMSTSCHS